MARLNAERTDCQLPFRDLSAYAAGNTGIPYAFTFKSGRPGPHVLITGLSHGNEPGGRDAVTALIDKVRPEAGTLSLALLNLDAHQASNGVDPYGRRFVDHDFNRVWDDAILDGEANSREIVRARQVRPLVQQADALLDIHATPYEASPYFVLKPGSKGVALAERLGTPRTRILFEQGSVHQPTITNYRQFADPASPAVALSLETGLFFARTSATSGLSTAIRLLRLKGVIGPEAHEDLVTWSDPGPVRRVRVLFPEIVETTDIALLFRPDEFRPRPEGEIVAYDAGRPIRAPFEGAVPLWIKQTFEAGIQGFMWARLEAGPDLSNSSNKTKE